MGAIGEVLRADHEAFLVLFGGTVCGCVVAGSLLNCHFARMCGECVVEKNNDGDDRTRMRGKRCFFLSKKWWKKTPSEDAKVWRDGIASDDSIHLDPRFPFFFPHFAPAIPYNQRL